MARAAGLRMASHGRGSIVNVGSELSHFGMRFYVHYCAGKAGVLGLTRGLVAELAPHVTVNAVCPGPVDTPMLESEIRWFGSTEQVRKETYQRVPLERLAQPEEVARAVRFLAFDAPYCMGFDGGTTVA